MVNVRFQGQVLGCGDDDCRRKRTSRVPMGSVGIFESVKSLSKEKFR